MTRNDPVAVALNAITAQFNTLDGDQQKQFVESLACISLMIMRGMKGVEYCRGFIAGFESDLNKPETIYTAPRSH